MEDIDCTFNYFMPSGKWKYEGRGKFSTNSDGSVDHFIINQTNKGMPGIAGTGRGLTICVTPDESCTHPYAFPRLIHSPIKETE